MGKWFIQNVAIRDCQKTSRESYYVSFTSIHDVRIHPVSTVQPRRILRSLKDVNKMFNQASDILSRQIFVYDNEKKELKPMEM